jgi:DNA-binding HxlR family transcriptional regulator
MNNPFRCNCPVTSALDIVGDKWTLVIIKQMLLEGKKTFKDFSESAEAIASNILSSRLKMLEEFKIISKEKLPHNKKTNIYLLTEKGLELTPTIIELTLWSDRNIREDHSSLISDNRIEMVKKNKEETVKMLIESYKTKNLPQQNPNRIKTNV